MNILYDHQIFSEQKYGGISRYFAELLKAFENKEGIKTTTPLIVSNNHYISECSSINYQSFLPTGFEQSLDLSYINKINTQYYINNADFDIFHPTYYDPYFLGLLKDKPYIVTVYDMIHEKFENLFSSADKTPENKKKLVENATKVIAISESTKKDLIDIYNMDPAKIEVVYLGNSLIPTHDPNFEIPMGVKKYILFVGARYEYKNFTTFIKAAKKNLDDAAELSVVCVGGGAFNKSEKDLMSDLGIADRVFQFDLDDTTLSLYYQNAELFVFPSLYEGFGIPVLESFACDCPLICSNTSSLPEIANNGAEYFDPYSQESIYLAIKKVLEDSNRRKELIDNGRQRLAFFSWEKTAQDTKKIYEDLLV
ncbi:glycosyltransferase family 4 protein [Francisella philomiragia]|uniref:Glycosyl transferases group 1 family protein n=1 Tax=Francisella philomiragia TaxID=28110 RepID=A0AAW3DB19_9GAMM|nr:glycosyltransferase family 1 protein [Francisella philomiragia]KFJ42392.1 glycosyl transferases group 1 family protein [Francisella philomiragia]MBK2255595.1 glycosyltransferase family 4 protein [Francisella philomiragia]MBK2273913.1 glycosyltransferase family 4 protein [Francisella philomiragia]MBK2277750.1 glycosyltransferase family 4 protein [Francisella philomiragia]MBK2281668.1 glycosyltransferase family 4 protein [Francisella philomiragia]